MNRDHLKFLSDLEGKYNLPKGLLAVQQQAESNFNPEAVSPVGALGIAQFMPATAKQYGIDPLDPVQASEGQARMMADLLGKYQGNVPKALAAYNWGQGNVDKKGLENAPEETRNYLAKIVPQLGIQENAPEHRVFSAIKPSSLDNFMNSVGNAIIPSANAAEDDDWEPISADQLGPEQIALQNNDEWEPVSANQIDSDSMRDNALVNTLTNPLSALTSYAANAMQAIPFADEVGSGIGALLGLGQGADIGERYNNLQQAQQAMREAGEQAQPSATALGELSGGLASMALLPVPQTAAKNYVDAAVRGAKYGAGLGALYGAGETDSFVPTGEAVDTRLKNTLGAATTGAVVGAPLGAIAHSLVPKKAPVSIEDQFKKANQLYAAAEQKGGSLKENFVNNFVDDISKVAPQTRAGKIVAGNNPVSTLVNNMQALRDKPLTLREAQEVDEALGDLMDNYVKPNGSLEKTGKKILEIQNSLRQKIMDAKPSEIAGGKEGFFALRDARKEWSRAVKMAEIDRIIKNGELSDNPATSIRAGFRAMLKNPKRLRGYTKAEQDLIREASKAGIGQETMRAIGSRLVGIISGATGNIPAALAAQVVGAGARGAAGSAQAQKGLRVIEQISGSGPAKTPGLNKAVAAGTQQTILNTKKRKK